jgi:hypothetical protein
MEEFLEEVIVDGVAVEFEEDCTAETVEIFLFEFISSSQAGMQGFHSCFLIQMNKNLH